MIGVQPEAGDDARRSLEAGQRVELPVPRTICDGQQAPIGDNTWAVIRERVDEVVVASDAEVVDAMRFAFERLKLVVEPSGACALAALLAAGPDVDGNASASHHRRQRRPAALRRADGLDGPVGDEPCELAARADVELAVDARQVRLDRADAHEQRRADLAVAHALGDELGDRRSAGVSATLCDGGSGTNTLIDCP